MHFNNGTKITPGGLKITYTFCGIIIIIITIANLLSIKFFSGPKLLIDRKEINLGDIPTGEKRDFQIKVTNIGDKPLQIKQIKPSCGCTTTKKPDGNILPGKSDFIQLTFNTYAMYGRGKKHVRIFSNDPVESSQDITFEANIIREFELVRPSTVVFLAVQRVGRKYVELVGLRNVSGRAIEVNRASTQSKIMHTVTPQKLIAAGDTAWVKITLLPREEGDVEEEFILETNSVIVPHTIVKVQSAAVLSQGSIN